MHNRELAKMRKLQRKCTKVIDQDFFLNMPIISARAIAERRDRRAASVPNALN